MHKKHKTKFDLAAFNLEYDPERCCLSCMKTLKHAQEVKKYIHINIEQPKQIHFFCSTHCKMAWIRKLRGI